MDTNIIDGDVNVFTLYPRLNNENHDEIINSIEYEIQNLFTNEINHTPYPNVLLIEGKGLKLFVPYLKNIISMQGVSSLKIIGTNPLSRESPEMIRMTEYSPINRGNHSILLTDAIFSGTEIDKIIDFYNHSLFRKKIRKVYGYLAYESGKNKVEQKYPEILFKFLKVTTNEEDYKKIQDDLKIVYQSRMVSADGDHPIWIINTEQGIGLEELKNNIRSTFSRKGFDCYIKDNPIVVKDKNNFTLYFNNYSDMVSECGYCLAEDEILKMSIRFKFSKERSKLRIKGIVTPQLLSETKKDSIRRLVTGKCQKKLPIKMCKSVPFYVRRQKKFRNFICPHCVEHNLSNCLINFLLKNYKK